MKKVISDWEKEYKHLEGKRLLLLGGMRKACDFVFRAHKMGVYVVVADMTEGAPAKQYSDKAIFADVTNVDVIVDICKREKIDGIITGYVDILLKPYHDACKKLGFPTYVTDLMISMATDKNSFKANCRKYGIPVPEDYEISDITSDNQLESLKYPVFLKPADNSGSRGAYRANNKEEFIVNYKKALTFSPSGRVVVEQCLTGQDTILDYLIKDGEPKLLSVFDRRSCEDRPVAINHDNLSVAPSFSTDLYLQSLDSKIVKMCKELGFKNGVIFFQGFAKKDGITLFEMGARMGGTFQDIDEAFLGINAMDELIHFALSGKMSDYSDYQRMDPHFSGAGAVIDFLLKPETKRISYITGMDVIRNMPEVKNCMQFYKNGDIVPQNNATDKPVLILYIAAENYFKLSSVLENIYSVFDVFDEFDNSLLLPVFHLNPDEYISNY